MAFDLTIQSLSQAGWQGTPGQNRADSKSEEECNRALNLANAQTSKDALAYIEQLYKAGRIGEVVALLRKSQVFRMAWQIFQQSSCIDSEAPEFASSIPTRTLPSDGLGLPVGLLSSGPKGQIRTRDLLAQQLTAAPESSRKNPVVQTYPARSSRLTRLLTYVCQVYETQAHYFAQERDNLPYINLRV